jgi:hypothetical protein
MALFSKQPKRVPIQKKPQVKPLRRKVQHSIEVGSFLMMFLPLVAVGISLWLGWSTLQTPEIIAPSSVPPQIAAPSPEVVPSASVPVSDFKQSTLRGRDPQGIIVPSEIQSTPAVNPF